MKRTMLIAVAAAVMGLFGTEAVLAQQAPAKTREQVKAECEAARKAGKIVEGECQKDPAVPASTKSKEQVKAETDAAKKSGAIVSGTAEAPKPMAAGTSTKTREQVKAECDAARKAGKIVEGECKGMPAN